MTKADKAAADRAEGGWNYGIALGVVILQCEARWFRRAGEVLHLDRVLLTAGLVPCQTGKGALVPIVTTVLPLGEPRAADRAVREFVAGIETYVKIEGDRVEIEQFVARVRAQAEPVFEAGR